MPDFDAQNFALGLTNYLVLLFSLSFHESAHAWMALKLGDDTAASLGRITLNPVPHIDVFGTILMPLLQIFGGFGVLGWAKPTPYDPSRFRRDVSLRRGHISVAVAGPLSNLILVIVFSVLLAVAVHSGLPQDVGAGLLNVFKTGVILNVTLALFNLLPIPPLDGSHLLSWSLPRDLGEKFDSFAHGYGTLLLFVLFFSGLLGWLIDPPQRIVLGLIQSLIF
ncbi:MAG: site-2 protease family protein [Vicinamibacteria bacterium]|nr:site-2 protease family protein [Vicinamibacteria bacterium]